MLKMNENEKAVIEAVERHNAHCERVVEVWEHREDWQEECIQSMLSANVASGIGFCCRMRELKIDAVVDMVLGFVLPRSKADNSEIDGKPRYMTFEWAEEEEEET